MSRWFRLDGFAASHSVVFLVVLAVASASVASAARVPVQTPPRSGRLWPRLPGWNGAGQRYPPYPEDQATAAATPTFSPAYADVEMLTAHVGLANQLRGDNASIARELAKALDIPASRVEVIPWSWPEGGKGTSTTDAATTEAAIGAGVGVAAASSLQQQVPEAASVQMLTRDAPLVARLQHGGAHLYAEYIASFLSIPATAVVVTPPALDDFPGPSPAPAPAAANSASSALTQVLVRNATDASNLSQAPAPAPAPAPEVKPINRAWIAAWSVTITWPGAATMVTRLAAALNDPSAVVPLGNDDYPFPQTLARVPSMEYPGVQAAPGSEIRLPPPRDTAMVLGPDPGGHHGATETAPTTEAQVNTIRANAAQALQEGMELQAAISGAKMRFVEAAAARRKELFASDGPNVAPQIRPPEVAGPGGTEGDSFYGPWPPGVPLTIANRVGGWTHAGDSLLATEAVNTKAPTSPSLRATRLRRGA